MQMQLHKPHAIYILTKIHVLPLVLQNHPSNPCCAPIVSSSLKFAIICCPTSQLLLFTAIQYETKHLDGGDGRKRHTIVDATINPRTIPKKLESCFNNRLHEGVDVQGHGEYEQVLQRMN